MSYYYYCYYYYYYYYYDNLRINQYHLGLHTAPLMR